MNSSGIFLGNTPTKIIPIEGKLWRYGNGAEPLIIAEYAGDINFLCSSIPGRHFAFWDRGDESFHLMNCDGLKIWSKRINTDKAIPLGIYFSPSGDGVAFKDVYDGSYRLHFYNIERKYSTEFGPFQDQIGHDVDLRRFIVSAADISDDEDLLLIQDRHGTVRGKISKGSWNI